MNKDQFLEKEYANISTVYVLAQQQLLSIGNANLPEPNFRKLSNVAMSYDCGQRKT